jgi:hypothetical protein
MRVEYELQNIPKKRLIVSDQQYVFAVECNVVDSLYTACIGYDPALVVGFTRSRGESCLRTLQHHFHKINPRNLSMSQSPDSCDTKKMCIETANCHSRHLPSRLELLRN